MTVDQLKVARLYREAGRLAREEGCDRRYGPHFGMRSTREAAMREFYEGFDEERA